MITVHDFEAALASLQFIKNELTFSRAFPEFDCEMKVDFAQKNLFIRQKLRDEREMIVLVKKKTLLCLNV